MTEEKKEKKEKPSVETIRHSLSHILAAAVLEMFPEAKLGIGPAIENGFYYDFDLPRTLIPEDLTILEDKMKKIIAADYSFDRKKEPKAEAIKFLEKAGQPYKIELAGELKDDEVGFYEIKNDEGKILFVDMCAGPHVESTKFLRSSGFKLDKTAAAYWRGDEKNSMMQRIYSLAFESRDELKNYEQMMAEAAKRDHRKLGKELGLFVFSDLVGPGLPLYTPKGTILRNNIANYSRELRAKIGYQEVQTPNMNKAELFKISGHYDKYKDDMFEVHSHYTEEEYYLKPMNCPQHTQIFASAPRSYKDLPIRIADMAVLYRDEKPGELSGLTRLRAFCQDDGHCFCREDQIKEEFIAVLSVIREAMTRYGMNYDIRLSLRDESKKEKYLGSDEVWVKSQKMLRELLEDEKIDFVISEGEAAFYGPKMDLLAKDSLGREWQLSTIQLDFNMPGRFNLEYITEDGSKKTPVMIHNAIVGSPERFMGVLIEHYAGAFPVWLAPIQARILPIADRHFEYARKIRKELSDAGIRVELDDRTESVGRKIREAEMQKIPVMLVIGDKEIESGKVALRKYKEGDRGQVEIQEVVKSLK
ncbi:MAG: threonine--tRNA ligase [Candidatus Berkelbacteria bacterium]|nr:threonine--tRNA ligase [Candidatus Berkelbacteria bacterium]